MAWRPNEQFIEGVLDNTRQGKITGWMKFAGIEEKVTFDLDGNFHRDIRGSKVLLRGDGEACDRGKATSRMQGFSMTQKGKAGDMTAGLQPADYVEYPYFEWYSQDNGRVVIELNPDQVELLTRPIPACESDPIDRKEQNQNLTEFVSSTAEILTATEKTSTRAQANNRIRGMELLTEDLREKLPPLGSQDGKGGKALAHCKLFTPDSSFTWWILEAEPVKDRAGNVIDYQMFGLVEGHCKELGYISLQELEELRGPLGLPVERDLYFRPTTLDQIAPEMFKSSQNG
ncbi:hypothetical protein STSP2_01897 [Anaerohalosphaera lusitana]|uniref:DUF2958 domain-containing protein n=1 Tax=Anaerohalosphaera lusitana TaxID=1936003 RepID=A0A1U9NLL7_9BACT|nr:DUF2958 domain-containing protein [Anaerohalosphaera lusitana]AQT68725.1 hypothetical protein STSP2_01897 [Anaerohalosphaera lusitana]